MALSPIGEVKRRIQEVKQLQSSNPVATQTSLLRQTLMRMKSDFEKMVEVKRQGVKTVQSSGFKVGG